VTDSGEHESELKDIIKAGNIGFSQVLHYGRTAVPI
jgi:hypothetical protein